MHQHGSIPFGAAAAAAVPTSYPKVTASFFMLHCYRIGICFLLSHTTGFESRTAYGAAM
jgi:hypothetical protein